MYTQDANDTGTGTGTGTGTIPKANVRCLEKSHMMTGKLQARVKRLEKAIIRREHIERKFDQWITRIKDGEGKKWQRAKGFVTEIIRKNNEFNRWADDWLKNAQEQDGLGWYYAKEFANDMNNDCSDLAKNLN